MKARSRALNFLSLLTGSFATPAAENPTLAMIESAYRQLGLDARYINCDVSSEALGDAVRGARAMGWIGFNCSIPHKLAVIPYLDDLADSASIIGAVNCVTNHEGHLTGDNTDGQGFVTSLRTVADPSGREFVVFGAGGAARAIAVEAALAGAAAITVVNRDRQTGAELVQLLDTKTPVRAALVGWDHRYRLPEARQIVVNATSVGLFPDVDACLNIDHSSFRPTMIVADVIPNPPRTHLIREAEAAGCTTLDGLGMLVNVICIEKWTGTKPDPTVMRQTLVRTLQELEPTQD